MLYLQFQLDQQRYVMETSNVVALLPVVRIQVVPNTPEYVLGVINYRGESVPVIDMVRLIIGRAANVRLSTRIVVLDIKLKTGEVRKLGLMVEKATEVIKIQESDFQKTSIASDQVPYIVSTYADSTGIVHCISSNTLLSVDDNKLLFGI